MKNIVSGIIVLVLLAIGTVQINGQTTYSDTFDTSDDLNGWGNVGNPYSRGVENGTLVIGFDDIISILDNLSGQHPYSETGVYRGLIYTDIPTGSWEYRADMLITNDMLTQPQWGWSQNIVTQMTGGQIFLGVFNDPSLGEAVWRTGYRQGSGVTWTAFDAPVSEGWNTVGIEAFDDHYSVLVNGTALGSYSYPYGGMGPNQLSSIWLTGYPSIAYSTDSVTRSYNLIFDNVSLSSAVPEPSTYAAIAGLLVIGTALVRRRKKA